jgi:hypothetical protein
MPVEVKGLASLKSRLKKITPDLYKQMNKDIAAVMIPVRNVARSYVPEPPLSGWAANSGAWGSRRYDATIIRKGIYYSIGKTKPNQKGFRSLYYVGNSSAAGAIYETAKKPQVWVGPSGPAGKKYSHSSNPKAGQQFVDAMGEVRGTEGKSGRLIYRSWAEQNGKVIPAVIKAINTTVRKFNDKKPY